MEWITKKMFNFLKMDSWKKRARECRERRICLDKNNIRKQHTLFWLFCWKDCTRHSYLCGIDQDCMHSLVQKSSVHTPATQAKRTNNNDDNANKQKNSSPSTSFGCLAYMCDKSCSFTNPMPCTSKVKSTKNCSLPFCFSFVKRRQPLPLNIPTASKKLFVRLWCAVAHLHFSIVFDFAVLFVIFAINPFARQVCVCVCANSIVCNSRADQCLLVSCIENSFSVLAVFFYSVHVSSLIPLHFSYLGLSFLPLSVLVYCICSGRASYKPAMIFTFFLHTTRLLFLSLPFFDQFFFILCFSEIAFRFLHFKPSNCNAQDVILPLVFFFGVLLFTYVCILVQEKFKRISPVCILSLELRSFSCCWHCNWCADGNNSVWQTCIRFVREWILSVSGMANLVFIDNYVTKALPESIFSGSHFR